MDMNDNIQSGTLKRSLKKRHLNMITLGGAIGTGLFFASGNVVSQAGPGGALVAYGIMGVLVYFLMTSLGEMTTQVPVSGSFESLSSRFVDPAFGFAIGWNYWIGWALTVAAELVASALIIKFWFPDTPATLWAAIFLTLLMVLNVISVKSFGEAEYWFAGIKVTTIIIFLILGTLMIVGIIGGQPIGFDNWVLEGPEGQKAPFVGGIFTLINVFLVAGFSFQGTEMVGFTAGESENPRRDVPKAINTVFWRILIFYIGAITVIGFLIPFTDERLLNASMENVAASPFTLVFENAGFKMAASIMNLVILTAVLSCGNSGLYASTRVLCAMAREGKAPKLFGKINKRGVPMNALILTGAFAALSFLSSLVGDGIVYYTLYYMVGITGFFAWLGIAVCHYRFRRAYIAQGRNLNDLVYKSKWYPFGPIFAIVLCIIVIFGSNIWVFQGGNFSWYYFITSYILIPVFFILYFGYKYARKTKIVSYADCVFDYKIENENENE